MRVGTKLANSGKKIEGRLWAEPGHSWDPCWQMYSTDTKPHQRQDQTGQGVGSWWNLGLSTLSRWTQISCSLERLRTFVGTIQELDQLCTPCPRLSWFQNSLSPCRSLKTRWAERSSIIFWDSWSCAAEPKWAFLFLNATAYQPFRPINLATDCSSAASRQGRLKSIIL